MTNLTVIDAEPVSPTVLDRIEEVRAEARAGKVSSVAIALVYRDGSTTTTWSDTPSWATLRGAVAHLGWRMSAKKEGGE